MDLSDPNVQNAEFYSGYQVLGFTSSGKNPVIAYWDHHNDVRVYLSSAGSIEEVEECCIEVESTNLLVGELRRMYIKVNGEKIECEAFDRFMNGTIKRELFEPNIVWASDIHDIREDDLLEVLDGQC